MICANADIVLHLQRNPDCIRGNIVMFQIVTYLEFDDVFQDSRKSWQDANKSKVIIVFIFNFLRNRGDSRAPFHLFGKTADSIDLFLITEMAVSEYGRVSLIIETLATISP